jgi:hypothetical protein
MAVAPAVSPDTLPSGVGVVTEHSARRESAPLSGIIRSAPRNDDVPASVSYSAADCPCCYRPLIVSWKDAGPASDVLQDAFGCDPENLDRFFEPEDWLRSWDLPLHLTWGTAAEWHAIRGIWRATRSRKEGRFLSLTEIGHRSGGSGG